MVLIAGTTSQLVVHQLVCVVDLKLRCLVAAILYRSFLKNLHSGWRQIQRHICLAFILAEHFLSMRVDLQFLSEVLLELLLRVVHV